jgi:hypothetical protein
VEPKFILAFVLGFVFCKIFNILFLTKSLYKFILQVHLETLYFLGLVAENLAFIRALKYKAILESGQNDEDVKRARLSDAAAEEQAKEAIVTVYKTSFPQRFDFIVKDMTWESAMADLTNKIKNQRSKDAL